MRYLHYELDAGPDDLIEARLDAAANVRLLDDANFERYRRDESHEYVGGYVKVSPYLLKPPRRARWHLVVDLGGRGGEVSASVRRLPSRSSAGVGVG